MRSPTHLGPQDERKLTKNQYTGFRSSHGDASARRLYRREEVMEGDVEMVIQRVQASAKFRATVLKYWLT